MEHRMLKTGRSANQMDEIIKRESFFMKRIFLSIFIFCFLLTGIQQVFAEQRIGHATEANVNVREKPSTKAKVIVNLKERYHPMLVDEEMIVSEGRNWYKVELFVINKKFPQKNVHGYVVADYIQLVEKNVSETTYIQLPQEIWGLKIGMDKSEIKDLVKVEDKDNKGSFSYYAKRNIQLTPKLKLEKIVCDIDDKDKLVGFGVKFSHDAKKIEEMYNYAINTYGDTKDNGGEEYEGADGIYLFWTDKDKGLTVCLSYYDYDFLDYMVNLDFGLTENIRP